MRTALARGWTLCVDTRQPTVTSRSELMAAFPNAASSPPSRIYDETLAGRFARYSEAARTSPGGGCLAVTLLPDGCSGSQVFTVFAITRRVQRPGTPAIVRMTLGVLVAIRSDGSGVCRLPFSVVRRPSARWLEMVKA